MRRKKMWKRLIGQITIALAAGAVGSTAMAANLIAAVSSDPGYGSNDVGTLTGSRVTTDVDVDSAGWRVKGQDGDTAVFNFHYKGKSYLLTRYGRSGKSRFSDAQGNWLALNDNAAGHFVYHNSTPNIHEITYNDGFVYVTGYDNPHISVAKLEGDKLNDLSFQKAADYTNDIVHNFKEVDFHGEGIAIRGNDLYALVTANPNHGYESYADSYVLKYKMNSDGSLSHEKGKDVVRVGKNSTEIEPYNNLLMIPSMGGMLSNAANPTASLDIVDISGGQMKTHRVKVPEAVGLGKTTEARNMHVTPEGNVYVLVGAYANDFHGSTGGVWKTTVSNLMSDNPEEWTLITDFEKEKDGGYNWDVYAEENPRRVWVNAGNKIKLYIDGKETPIVFPIEKFGSSKEKIYVNMDGFRFLAPAQVAGEAPNQARLLDIPDNETMITGKDKNVYTYTTDAVLGPETNGAGDLKSNVAAGAFARDYGDITLDAKEKDLTINADTGIGTPVGIYAGNGKNVTVNAKKLTVNTNSPTGGETKTSAIWLDAAKDKAGKITINAPLHIEMTGGEGGYGIAVKKTDRWGEAAAESTAVSEIVVNGDVSLTGTEGRQWGLPVNHKNVYGRLNNAGLYTAVDKSKITINGSVNLAVHGNGATALSKDSEINVKGGKITVPTGKNYAYYALAAYDGTVRMNTGSDGKTPGAEKVEITGDLYAGKNGKIDVAMTTSGSYLKGIVNSMGAVRAYLQNGAAWVNERQNTPHEDETEDVGSRGKSRLGELIGGKDEASAGLIFQKDQKGITIDKYSGYTKIFYDHDSDLKYSGGTVTVGSAESGSGITLRTGNNGIDTSDEDITRTALNTLAGKLVYGSYPRGERNLNGKVEIAEGLTAASASIKIGDISFSESTGVGSYGGLTPEEPPEEERIDAPIVEPADLKTDHVVNAVDGDAFGSVVTALTYRPKDYKERFAKAVELQKQVMEKQAELAAETDPEKKEQLKKEIAELNNEKYKLKKVPDGIDPIHVNYHDLALNVTAEQDGQEAVGIYLKNYGNDLRAEIIEEMKAQGLIDDQLANKVWLESVRELKIDGIRPDGPLQVNVRNNGSGDAYGIKGAGDNPMGTVTLATKGDIRIDVEAKKGDAYGVYGLSYAGNPAERGTLDIARVHAEEGKAVGYVLGKRENLYPKLKFGDISGKKGSIGLYVTGEWNGTTKIDGISGSFSGNVIEADFGSPIFYSCVQVDHANIDLTGKEGYAIAVKNGNIDTISMQGVGYSDNVFKGNMLVAKENEKRMSSLELGFKTWEGLMDRISDKAKASVTLRGGEWHHKNVGSLSEGFKGSSLTGLEGGTDASLFMEDDYNLETETFKGYMSLYYRHDTNPEIMKGGDLIIGKADGNGSVIRMFTQAEGVDTADQEKVTRVLDALARKLVYKGYTEAGGSERNLTMFVGLKEGLTASSAVKAMDIGSFNEADGRGYYQFVPNDETGPIRKDTVLTADRKAFSDYKKALYMIDMVTPIGRDDGVKTLTVDLAGHTLTAEASIGANDLPNRESGIFAGEGQTVAVNDSRGTGRIEIISMIDKDSKPYIEGVYGYDPSQNRVLRAYGKDSKIEINAPVSVTAGVMKKTVLAEAKGENSKIIVNGRLTFTSDMDDLASWTGRYLLEAKGKGSEIRISDFEINAHRALSRGSLGKIILGGGDYNLTHFNAGYDLREQDPYAILTSSDEERKADQELKKVYERIKNGGGKFGENISINEGEGRRAGDKRVRLVGQFTRDYNKNLTEPSDFIGLKGKDSWWINNDFSYGISAGGADDYTPGCELSLSDNARIYTYRSCGFSDGHGGVTPETAGIIYNTQRSYNINAFHTYDGYMDIRAPGQLSVSHAEPGSGMVVRKVVTLTADEKSGAVDWKNENLHIKEMYDAAYNIVYKNAMIGEDHLKTTLTFAESIKDDAEILHREEIRFDPKTGRGIYSRDYVVSAPEEQPDTLHGVVEDQLSTSKNKETGMVEITSEYLKTGVLVRPNEYVFRKDTEIRGEPRRVIKKDENGKPVKDENGKPVYEWKEQDPYNLIQANDQQVLVDLAGHGLAGKNVKGTAIRAEKTLTVKNAGKIDIQSKQQSQGIQQGGEGFVEPKDGLGIVAARNKDEPLRTAPLIHIQNDMSPDHALTLRNTGNKDSDVCNNIGILAYGSPMQDPLGRYRSVIRVDGLVDIELFNGRGMMADKLGRISAGGGRISTPRNYAIYAGGKKGERGRVNLNVEKENGRYVSTGHTVQIDGHIATNNLTSIGQWFLGATDNSGMVNVGLDTPDSYWKGRPFSRTQAVFYKGTSPKTTIQANGRINLILKNGATWFHEGEMAHNTEYHNSIESAVNSIQGGSDEAHRGMIYQKDNQEIRIRSLRGHTMAYFDRDGTDVEKILGGDIKVYSAVSERDGSHASMTLRTDNAGLTMTDEGQVERVLDNLAHKLIYTGYAEGHRALEGKVEIAEGLTAQSAQKSGYIAFDETTGQGSFSKTKTETKETGSLHQSVVLNGNKDISVDDKDNVLFYNAALYTGSGTPVAVDLAGHDLNLAAATKVIITDGYEDVSDETASYTMAGIAAMKDGKVEVTNSKDAGEVKMNVTGMYQQSVYGILGEENSRVSVNGKVNIEGLNIREHRGTDGQDERAEAVAVLAKGRNSEVALKSLSMGKDALVSTKDEGLYDPKLLKTLPLRKQYAHGVVARGEKSKITIGEIDLAMEGTGITAEAADSEIRIGKGHISSLIQEGNQYAFVYEQVIRSHAIKALNGTVFAGMNEAGTDASGEDLAVKGNIMARANRGEKGIIHLGLGSDKSSWNGVVDAEYMKGDINLYLKKGGTWTHQAEDLVFEPYHYKGSYVTNLSGGHTAEEAGIIFQKEDKPITVENYQGHTKIFYEHDIADPTRIIGGDFIVKNALKREDKNAVVEVITDRSGLDIHSEEDVEKTLDSLAHKLVYTGYVAGERNMDACAFIAEGLTAQSAAKWFGNVKFTDTEGRGTVEKAERIYPESQVENPMTKPIDGSEESEEAYSEAGIYKKNDDEYRFTKNPAGIHIEKTPSAAIIASVKDITVKADGGLEIISNPEGIVADSGKTAAITAKEVSVKVEDGNAVKADNGTVNITGNLAAGGKDGIKAENNGVVTVNGKVDITAEDKAAEALAGGRIILNGGGFMQGKVRADQGSVSGEELAVRGDITADNGGSVTFNGGKVGSDLVSGNGTGSRIELIGGGYSIKMLKADNGGIITLKTNPESPSEIKGIHSGENSAVNVTVEGGTGKLAGDVTGTGAVKLALGNQAVWEGKSSNENTEATVNSTWKNTGETKLKKLGGSGTVDMTQSGEGKTEIKEYNGTLTLIYAHENANPVNMKGNNFHIGKAAEGSKVRMLTDNAGLNTSSDKAADKNQVSAALNALAGKLYYEAYVAGEKNLEGTVEIAEGLTAQSATKRLETMTYKAETGQGQYLYTPAVDPNPPIIYGDKETRMMRGSKTAMVSAILLWRANNNDLERRMGDIRLGKEENGIWARYLGGKNELDKQKTSFKQTYNIAQVGYDKKKGNWTIGAALDYGTGKDTYANGTGKEKLASLALYGAMQKEDGQYLDIILRGSRIKNDYTVYNEMNHRLDGKYRTGGLSVSVEYGKRIARENGFYIDPSIELTAGRLSGKDYDAVSDMGGNKKMHVHQEGVTSVIGRIGLGIGKETERSNLFAKIGLAHEFGGTVKSIFSAEGEPTSGTRVDMKDSWIDLEVGGSFLVNRNTYLYGTYTRNFGADLSNKWRIDAGIRFSF